MSAARPHGTQRRGVVAPTQQAPTSVRLRWLLTALGLLVVAAFCCAYLSLCLLFAQGQWQLLYRPSTAITATPASLGLGFTAVRFGATETGVSQLTGWWLPASTLSGPSRGPSPETSSNVAGTTVLYLHDAVGSLSDSLSALARLHALGCSVFAIDYRGFGASAPVAGAGHPNEASMVEDAGDAIAYLSETRHLDPGSMVLWGRGIGATVAAEASFPENGSVSQVRRLVMEDASEPALTLLSRDGRTRLLPLRLLLRDRLDAGPALSRSSADKLFLTDDPSSPGTRRLYSLAAEPKRIARSGDDAAALTLLTVRSQPAQ